MTFLQAIILGIVQGLTEFIHPGCLYLDGQRGAHPGDRALEVIVRPYQYSAQAVVQMGMGLVIFKQVFVFVIDTVIDHLQIPAF